MNATSWSTVYFCKNLQVQKPKQFENSICFQRALKGDNIRHTLTVLLPFSKSSSYSHAQSLVFGQSNRPLYLNAEYHSRCFCMTLCQRELTFIHIRLQYLAQCQKKALICRLQITPHLKMWRWKIIQRQIPVCWLLLRKSWQSQHNSLRCHLQNLFYELTVNVLSQIGL